MLGLFGFGERLRDDELRGAAGTLSSRRVRLALVIGIAMAAGALVARAAAPVNAYEDPVSPSQGSEFSTFVVEGGVQYPKCPVPAPGYIIDFYFDKASGGPQIWQAQAFDCVNGKQDTGPSPAIAPPAGRNAPGQHSIEMDVFNTQQRTVVATATQPYTIVGPTLTVVPACGSTGLPVTLSGAGFRANTVVDITFTPPAGGKPVATPTPTQVGTFQAVVAIGNVRPGNYTFVATQNFVGALAAAQLVARAPFTVPCVAAAIVLNPKVGPPGTVITVTGTGFPVGAVVKLSWDQGIKMSLPSITIGASEGFKVVVLIFPHDELGGRVMSASPDLTVTTAPLFNIATAKFLVVPGTEQPRDFSWRH